MHSAETSEAPSEPSIKESTIGSWRRSFAVGSETDAILAALFVTLVGPIQRLIGFLQRAEVSTTCVTMVASTLFDGLRD